MYFGKLGHCIVPTEANILSGQNAEKRDCPDEFGTVGNPDNIHKHTEELTIDNYYARSTCCSPVNDVSIHNVQTAVENFKLGKSCGPDGIFAEAIKFGGSLLRVHLGLLLSASLRSNGADYVLLLFIHFCLFLFFIGTLA